MSLPAAAEQQQKARDFEPIVEYKSIGWEVDGIKTPHKLTMNLGLWCLHMMARNDGFLHKPGECSDSMSPSASFSNDETKKRKGVGSFSKSTGSSLDRARKRRKIDDGSFRSDTTMASV